MFYQKIKDVIIGKVIWYYVKHKYKSDIYIIVPNDMQLKVLALFYLESYCKKGKLIYKYTSEQMMIKTVTIITSNPKDKIFIDMLFNYQYQLCNITEHKINQLLKFYALADSSLPWIIASIDNPYDNHSGNLIACGLATMKEIVCFDIYRMNSVPRVDIPEYTGNDEYVNLLMNELKRNIV